MSERSAEVTHGNSGREARAGEWNRPRDLHGFIRRSGGQLGGGEVNATEVEHEAAKEDDDESAEERSGERGVNYCQGCLRDGRAGDESAYTWSKYAHTENKTKFWRCS